MTGTPMVDEVGATWLDRDLVRVTGPDAETFLQGQLSQEVSPGPSRFTLVLQPQGKVDAWARLSSAADGDGFVLDIEGGWGERLLERLDRFLIRVKVELRLDEGVRMLAIRGPSSRDIATGAAFASEHSWHRWHAVDVVGATESPDGLPLVDRDAYEVARVRMGFPAMGAELDEKTIPAEVPGLVESSVSFTKGCYTGQELVARIDSRGGNVPRRLRVLELSGPVREGADVVHDGKVVGAITSTAGSFALAFIGRGVASPADVTVRSDAGSAIAVVREVDA